MKRYNKYGLSLIFMLLIGACKEDEIELFIGEPAINIGVLSADGKHDEEKRNVNFVFMKENDITINFMVMLEGMPEARDRKVKIEIGGNAINGQDFEITDEIILKAGEHKVLVPCHLKRTESLMDNSRNVTFKFLPDEEFISGHKLSAEIVISDGMPDNWVNGDYAVYTLGECSKMKYRFLYDLLNIYDLDGYTDGELRIMANYLNAKVLEYNVNPDKFDNKYGPVPMVDENGKEVIFAFSWES